MKSMKSLLIVLLLLCTPVAFAQADIVGKDAPEFSAAATFNETEHRTLADCAGDVTVVRIY